MTTLAAAATRYAEAGFRVLPCTPRDKHPLGRCVPHGFKDATRDTQMLSLWWSRHPDANIGIVPGSAGYVVLDVDNVAAAEGLAQRFGVDVQSHPCVVITSRGWHCYYRYTGDPLGQPKLAPDVDVRSHVGFVLAPPSVHPSGHTYRWLNSVRLADAPPLPFAILRAITEPKPLPMANDRTRDVAVTSIAPVAVRVERFVERWLPSGLSEGGGRKRYAFTFAVFLIRELGLSTAEAEEHVTAWNQRNAEPLPEAEVKRCVRDAQKKLQRAA